MANFSTGFPFKSLNKQSRMRPEFALMLREIYPEYRDNLEIVSKNKPLKCVRKSMVFWTHSHPEGEPNKQVNVSLLSFPTFWVKFFILTDEIFQLF